LALPDARAKREYRQRLEGLREAEAEAERCNDAARAAAAREQIELLTAELGERYAFGPGRARQRNAVVEKMRKSVAKCVRSALAKIKETHPPLGRHLAVSLKMGTFCSYDPEKPTAWSTHE